MTGRLRHRFTLQAAATLVALILGSGTVVVLVSSRGSVPTSGNSAAAVIAAVVASLIVSRFASALVAAGCAGTGAAALIVGTASSSTEISLFGTLGGGAVLGALAAVAATGRLWTVVFGVAVGAALLLSVGVVTVPRSYAQFTVAEDELITTYGAALAVTVGALALTGRRDRIASSGRTTGVALVVALVGLVPVLTTNVTAALGATGLSGTIDTTSSWAFATVTVTIVLIAAAIVAPSAGALILGGIALWLLSRPASVVVLSDSGSTGPAAVHLIIILGSVLLGAAAGHLARPTYGVPLAFGCAAAAVAALYLGATGTWIAIAAVGVAAGIVVGSCVAATDVPPSPTLVAAGMLVPLALATMPTSPVSADFGWTAYTPLTSISDSVTFTRPVTGTLVSMMCLALCAVGAEVVRRRRS